MHYRHRHQTVPAANGHAAEAERYHRQPGGASDGGLSVTRRRGPAVSTPSTWRIGLQPPGWSALQRAKCMAA